ncbi:hypothetical protein MTR67_001727 [Solanum verrucosum]|uniref:Uncharacterized protein n=1 Tax=Solanum verrucosum TaxID=315347 RepID=A0AAF0PPQ8_SOLVR|nr:hypothetical protein MTR67_001727 [Solanum verrucosum]
MQCHIAQSFKTLRMLKTKIERQ